jgi:glyoxylase-like metal-dependent hydrolase (beta-lactamase superfamily II)
LKPFADLFRDYMVPLADKTTFLKPGDEVVPGIRAMAAYGHTPGHLAFDIESGGKRLVFWGDCAHHHVASLVRPDWHCVFDVDREQGAKTRARMFDKVATDRVAVSAFHMPFPSSAMWSGGRTAAIAGSRTPTSSICEPREGLIDQGFRRAMRPCPARSRSSKAISRPSMSTPSSTPPTKR